MLIAGGVLSGAFIGVNNTLITETVMKIAPVARSVSSAAYSFVRFGGGAIAPWLAGTLGERSIRLPFFVGAGAVAVAVLVPLTAGSRLHAIDADHSRQEPVLEAEAVGVGDA